MRINAVDVGRRVRPLSRPVCTVAKSRAIAVNARRTDFNPENTPLCLVW